MAEDYLRPSLWKYAEETCWFVHRLYMRRVLDRRNPKKFAPLKAEYLRTMLPSDHYQEILADLEAGGVIEIDRHYVVGVHSRGYRLTPRWQGVIHRRMPVTKSMLMRRLNRGREDYRARMGEVPRWLEGKLDCLAFDYDEAVKVIGDDKDAKLRADVLRDRQIYCQPCKYGRLHTNYTTLNTYLRDYLSVDGETLINVDIANSQPLLFALMLLDYHHNGGYLTSIRQLLNTDNKNKDTRLNTMWKSVLSDPDAKRYVELCQEGQLYHAVAEEGLDVKEVKKKLFKDVFFGKLKYGKKDNVTPLTRAFEAKFPSVMKVIKTLKTPAYKFLSRTLQRWESDFVIDVVCRRLMTERPEMFVATIHDSLVVREKDAAYATDVLRTAFKSLGLTPTLRHDVLTPRKEQVA